MNTSARLASFGIAAAATLTLAACSSGTTTSAGSTTAAPAATSSIASTSTAAASGGMMSGGMSSAGAMNTGPHNDADVTFAQQMIVHHQGAIEMTDLALTRAASQEVKDLAIAIKAAQAPEIEQMTGWLQAWGAGMTPTSMMSGAAGMGSAMMTSSDGAGGVDHGMGGSAETAPSSATPGGMQMPGMMTADQTTQLTAATGADFDKLFLQLMITHHQGAVQMAETELAQGANPDALALAESIKTSQTAEIATMQQLLATL